MQKSITLENKTYKIIEVLESDQIMYFYTIDPTNYNEVVFISRDKTKGNQVTKKVDEREYPILMNKFSLK